MSLVIDLRSPVSDDLSREAEHERVSPAEHAQILLSLIWTLRKDHQGAVSAQVIKDYLRSRSLDAELFITVFDDLVRLLLKNQCDPVAIDEDENAVQGQLPSIKEMVQRFGRRRRTSARGAAAHLGVSTEDVMREHQEDIAREEKGWY